MKIVFQVLVQELMAATVKISTTIQTNTLVHIIIYAYQMDWFNKYVLIKRYLIWMKVFV